jgi:hypothetical protein
MKIINDSFVIMLDQLENFSISLLHQPWLDRNNKRIKGEKRELEREREKMARWNPKIVLGKVFLARNQQETRDKRRNKRT